MTIPGPTTVVELAARLGPAHREAVVLGGHEHAPAVDVEDRVVGAAVAEAQLERLEAEGAAEQLVPEADPEHRPRLEHRAHLVDARGERGGVAGPVGEQDAVGRGGEHLAAARASHGMTVTLAPASRRRRTIEPLTP